MRIVALISLIAVSLFPFKSNAIQYEQSEVDCLAKNIYFEARGESVDRPIRCRHGHVK
jgi:spore germination cell wall hydrolase CwlJ-like protein